MKYKHIIFVLSIIFVLLANTAFAVACSEKVTICHVPPGNPSAAHTITVDENALKAHLGSNASGLHGGDYYGECREDEPDTPDDPQPTPPPPPPTPSDVPDTPDTPDTPRSTPEPTCASCDVVEIGKAYFNVQWNSGMEFIDVLYVDIWLDGVRIHRGEPTEVVTLCNTSLPDVSTADSCVGTPENSRQVDIIFNFAYTNLTAQDFDWLNRVHVTKVDDLMPLRGWYSTKNLITYRAFPDWY